MSELIELISILGGGFLVMSIGLTIQIRKKRKKEKDPVNYSDSLPTTEEEQAKKYILTYKSSYPRESIRVGLKNMNIQEDKIETYLNKYI